MTISTIGRKRRARRARGRRIEARQMAVFRCLCIEATLAHRWGLASCLPADHPYKHGRPSEQATRRAFAGAKAISPTAHILEGYLWTPGQLNLRRWHSADHPLVQDGRVVGLQDLTGNDRHLLLTPSEDQADV